MKKGIIWIIVILLIIWGISALTGEKAEAPLDGNDAEAVWPAEGETIKIGASLPLTGEAASIGEGLLGALEYAVQAVNDEGGVNGYTVELIAEDDACSDDGINSFNKLVNVDQVDAIVGPMCSPAAGAGLPVAQKAEIPTIFWGSAPPLTGLGDYLFRSYPSDSLQGAAAAKYAFETLGATKAAILHVNNDWGVGLQQVFTEEFEALGGEIVITESILQTSGSARTELTKIKDAAPEVVFMPVFPQTGVIALKQSVEIGIEVPIIGGDAFDVPEVLGLAEAEGVLVFRSDVNTDSELLDAIEAATGKTTDNFSLYAYDAVNLMFEAISEVGIEGSAIKAYLETVEYTDAIGNDTIAFDEIGDLSTGKSAAYEIKGGELVRLETE